MFQEAAKQRHAYAQNMLGWCYQHGTGVERDEKKAVEWYEKAAEQGSVTARNNIYNISYDRNAITKKIQEVTEFYQKRSENLNKRRRKVHFSV